MVREVKQVRILFLRKDLTWMLTRIIGVDWEERVIV